MSPKRKSTKEPLQIPGYYYDTEKNRYFKLEANQRPPPISVVVDKSKRTTSSSSIKPKQDSFPYSCQNLVGLSSHIQLYHRIPWQSMRLEILSKYTNHSKTILNPGTGMTTRANHPHRQIKAFDIDKTDNCIYIAHTYQQKTFLSQSFYHLSRQKDGMELKETDFNYFQTVSSEITSLKVYSNLKNPSDTNTKILATFLNEPPHVVFPDGLCWKAEYLTHDVWCGSLYYDSNMLAFGSTNNLYIHEIGSNWNTKYKLDCPESSLLALNWSPLGNKLYMGFRNGNLLSYDVRSKTCAQKMKLNSCICDLKPLSNDLHLLTSEINQGEIQLFDVRNLKQSLTRYPGHVNGHERLLMETVDDTLVISPGSDSMVRAWNIWTGKLVWQRAVPDNSNQGCTIVKFIQDFSLNSLLDSLGFFVSNSSDITYWGRSD